MTTQARNASIEPIGDTTRFKNITKRHRPDPQLTTSSLEPIHSGLENYGRNQGDTKQRDEITRELSLSLRTSVDPTHHP